MELHCEGDDAIGDRHNHETRQHRCGRRRYRLLAALDHPLAALLSDAVTPTDPVARYALALFDRFFAEHPEHPVQMNEQTLKLIVQTAVFIACKFTNLLKERVTMIGCSDLRHVMEPCDKMAIAQMEECELTILKTIHW